MIALVCCLTACAKYDPKLKYVVVKKENDMTILVRESGQWKRVAFWIVVDKKTWDGITIGDSWCESPTATVSAIQNEPGCGGK